MNRVMQILSLVAVVSFLGAQAEAGDPFRTESKGAISSSSLSAMGLSGMKQVSNTQAKQVRGQGAIAFGFSFANFRLGPFTGTDFRGQAADGNNFAGTASLSTAGLVGGPVVFAGGIGVAGGF